VSNAYDKSINMEQEYSPLSALLNKLEFKYSQLHMQI